MKNLRNIFLAMVGVLTIASCETDADTVAEVHDEASFLVQVSTTSNSAILGSPEAGVDLEDAELTITNAYLNLTVTQMSSGTLSTFDKIEIVKSYNGGEEVSLGESSTLPYTLEVTTLTELLSGTGIAEADMRIGDELLIRTKIHKTDGSVYYYNVSMGNYSMIVNCASNLAGTYTNGLLPDCDGSGGGIATVTEVSPGRYWVSSMARYRFLPDKCIGFYMIDVCGVLTYDGGDLEDNNYDGDAETPGQVNADGSFTFTFQLPAAGYGPETITFTPL
ncbi:MAG: hypothetical protein ACPGU9_04780 [Flavobacteriaceae bacterium]